MINWLKVKQALHDWWLIRGDYDRLADSYALNAAARNQHLLQAIRYRSAHDRVILLLTHFPQAFEQAQATLEQADLSYEIGPVRLTPEFLLNLAGHTETAQASLLLGLASTLDHSELARAIPVDRQAKISMMVLERHPRVSEDRKLELFARCCPCPVKLGYLLCLDDPLIGRCIHPTVLDVLQQLGLRDQQLITSRMVSRRVDQVLKRIEWPTGNQPGADAAALHSAEAWLKLLPDAQQDSKEKTAGK